MKHLSLVAVAVAVVLAACSARADVSLPTGLAPGSQYQIAFLTSAGTTATSTNIADYNSFVTSQAALSSSLPTGVTWTAMVSTPSTSLTSNSVTHSNVPIYNTYGQLVVSNGTTVWSSSYANPIDYTQNGQIAQSLPYVNDGGHRDNVWVGELGLWNYFSGPPTGWATSGNITPSSCAEYGIGDEIPFSNTLPSNEYYGLYALSSPITVVPEPSTLVLLGIAVIGLVGFAWRRKRPSVAVLLVVFGALMFAAADRARAESVYYAGVPNGSAWSFGTVNSTGQTTVIATGLTFGGAGAEKLMFAPNGTLYGFDAGESGGGAWGSINTATGAFTQIGNLNTYFPFGLDHNESYGFLLAFGSSGNLYVTGFGTDANYDYGTLNLTTGAFTKIAVSPVSIAGSLVAPVPEPSTFVLLGIAIIGLGGFAWRQRKQAA